MAISWRRSNFRRVPTAVSVEKTNGRFGRSSAFTSRVTALPSRRLDAHHAGSAVIPMTSASSAPAASGPDFLELMTGFTESMPQSVDAAAPLASPDGPPREKKPRHVEEAMVASTQIRNLQVCEKPPAAAALEFALGRPVESRATELPEQTPPRFAQAGLPACRPEAFGPPTAAAGTPPQAEPTENDEPGKVASITSGEVARVPVNTDKMVGPDAALSRLATVPTTPAPQTDAVPDADVDAAPIRPEPERRQSVPHGHSESAASAPEAASRRPNSPDGPPRPTDRIAPTQTHLEATPAPIPASFPD